MNRIANEAKIFQCAHHYLTIVQQVSDIDQPKDYCAVFCISVCMKYYMFACAVLMSCAAIIR